MRNKCLNLVFMTPHILLSAALFTAYYKQRQNVSQTRKSHGLIKEFRSTFFCEIKSMLTYSEFSLGNVLIIFFIVYLKKEKLRIWEPWFYNKSLATLCTFLLSKVDMNSGTDDFFS